MPLSSDLEVSFELTISEIKYVLNYPETAKRPSFRMKELKLEYETVRDKQPQQEISNALTAGVQYFFDHVRHCTETVIKKKLFGLKAVDFLSEDIKQNQIVDIDAQSYYENNKFAIFIDLRSTEDNQLHGSGKIQLSGDDILLTMTKKKELSPGICHMRVYLVSDARLIIKNKELKSFDL